MADARSELGLSIDEAATRGFWDELIGALTTLTKSVKFDCKVCHAKNDVEIQDLDAQVKHLTTLLDQAKGRPVESRVLEVRVPQSVMELKEMSLAELEAFVASEEAAGR